MTRYEYKVIPAPNKPKRAKGARSNEERFASTLMTAMNELGADGWEYVRSDTLPVDVRSGIASRSKEYMSVLVFKRVITDDADQVIEEAPEEVISAPAPIVMDTENNAPELGSADELNEIPEDSVEEAQETDAEEDQDSSSSANA